MVRAELLLAERRRARAAFLVVFAIALGCAHAEPPVPVTTHLTWPLGDAANDRPVIGLGRFDDVRPRALRGRVTPSLRVGWLGFFREGDHRTGDSAFSGSIAEGLRADARATLERSGDFSAVRSVDFEPAALSARERRVAFGQGGVDYVLEASIQEFTGIQFQSFSITPARIGWVRNRYEAPIGRVEVHYRLFGPEGPIWSTRVETEYESPEGTIADAALEAMAITNERLAQDLHPHVAGDRLRYARLVTLQIMDGCEIGRRAAMRLVAEASLVFGREVGLVFRPSYKTWDPPEAPWHPAPLLDALRELTPPDDGFVIGVAPFGDGPRLGLPDDHYGLASSYGRHAVARCDGRRGVRALTVVHELGHLLGAVHVSERASVMHPEVVFDGRFFDPLNRRILGAASERGFGESLSASTAGRLRAIYRAAAQFPGEVDAADLASAQAALERVAAPQLGE